MTVLSKSAIVVPRFKLKSLQAVFLGSTFTSALFILHLYLKSRRRTKSASNNQVFLASSKSKAGLKKKVDSKFLDKLRKILRILIPTWKCPEVGFMSMISVVLIVRSLCDVWTIYLGTLLESAIITHDNKKFNRHLLEFAMTMPTMALVNAILKYGTEQLHIRFRSRLTKHLLGEYMKNLTFYKATLPNIDQLIATDVDRFSSTCATLYSQITKPVLDIFIYVYGISASVGKGVPGMMLGYLALAAGLLIQIRKPMAKMTAQEQLLEGEFRFVNSRLQINSEEVAFYGGNNRELSSLRESFSQLLTHLQSFSEFKFIMNFAENIIAKYIATVVGYYSVSRPFMSSSNVLNDMNHQQRLEAYYKSGRMLINLAMAMGRLVLNGKELSRLAGYTFRVDELMTTLGNLNAEQQTQNQEIKKKYSGVGNGLGVYKYKDNVIKFYKVPIVTPNGDMLLKELTLEVKSGTNVLVCGPNGCGKSSLFRILGELWPLQGGVLTKPRRENLFYIPQRPYMPMGNLRDQIIYPDTLTDMTRKGLRDSDLENILREVDLDWIVCSNKPVESCDSEEYLVGQRRSFDDVDNWMDCLSGGQKQRLAMARLLYHKPQFAILDECTSAISIDIEGHIYKYCKNIGITLFTVTHRKSLWEFHEYYLYMDGRGNAKFEKITGKECQEYGT